MKKKGSDNQKATYDVIIIGGGSSGLMTACVAAKRTKKSILVIEKNTQLGKKLAISGGGRCNITNALSLDQNDPFNDRSPNAINTFLEKFPQTKKFLYSSFSQFSVADTFTFFEKELNMPLTIQAKGRVFPQSEKASDVRNAMVNYANDHKVTFLCDTSVTDIAIDPTSQKISSVSCGEKIFHAKSFVIATGGLAAPETGSTGDGFLFLEKVGHAIKSPSPDIVPLTCADNWVRNLSGTKLSNIKISFHTDNLKTKKGDQHTGDILLTHFGLSGPLILNAAKNVRTLLDTGPVTATINLFPEINAQELDQKLIALFESHPKKRCENILPLLIPRALSQTILTNQNLLGKNTLGKIVANELSKNHRREITHILQNLNIKITGTLGFDKAVIADGGVIPEEVDFSTMRSRLYNNLYLTGDTLSINRPSGGYSLQLCWTTGFVAATAIAKKTE